MELLAELHRRAAVQVYVSVAFFDDDIAKRIEPSAPRPSRRFRTLSLLSGAGIPVGISLSPVIPGLNDDQIPSIVERAAACGATSAFSTLLRLPGPVEEVFFTRVREQLPDRARKIENFIRETRGGELNDSRFGSRMSGNGERWTAIRWMFNEACRRHGINSDDEPVAEPALVTKQTTFRRPREQLRLL